MAVNQVIHGSNRVVENPNRYKLNAVSGQANTYDLEKMPGLITDNGTPYNKMILDKMDNVLSYLTPSVEKVTEHEITPFNIPSLVCNNISTVFSQDSIIGEINGEYDSLIPNLNPKIKITGYDNSLVKTNVKITSSASSSNRCALRMMIGSLEYGYTNNDLTEILKRTTSDFTHKIILSMYNSYFYIDYDFETLSSFNFNCKYSKSRSTMEARIYTSDDGITYENVATITPDIDFTYNVVNKRYIRVWFRNNFSGSETIELNYAYFTNVVGEYDKVETINKFTLDNNGQTFVNNQRVLVETDKNIEEVMSKFNDMTIASIDKDVSPNASTTYTSFDMVSNTMTNGTTSITPTINITSNGVNFVYYYTGENNAICGNDGSGLASTKSSYLKTFLALKNEATNNAIRTIGDMNFIYDFKIPVYSKVKIIVSCNNIGENYTLYGSNDGLSYETLLTYTNTSRNFETIEYSANSKYRYYKFVTPQLYMSDFNLLSIYDIEKEEEIEIPYQGVTSNTLNGIDIPTLLQPSTKYELIYKEDTNKFELGKLSDGTLYDITLTESVHQVDLTGISDMLQDGKLYTLIINGQCNANGILKFGNQTFTYVYSADYESSISLFAIKDINGIKTASGISTGSSTTSCYNRYSQITNYEYLEFSIASTTFNVGTRIIIKEVA